MAFVYFIFLKEYDSCVYLPSLTFYVPSPQIHVGKAGGSSLYEKLGLKDNDLSKRIRVLKCHIKGHKTYDECFKSTMGGSPTRLFRATVGHRHLSATRYPIHTARWLKNNATILLFTVRYPTARVVSPLIFITRRLRSLGSCTKLLFTNALVLLRNWRKLEGITTSGYPLHPHAKGRHAAFSRAQHPSQLNTCMHHFLTMWGRCGDKTERWQLFGRNISLRT